jgi:hypothetical protein
MADSELLKNAVAGLLDRLEKTEKFALDQAPDICQQVIAEFKLGNIMQLTLGSLLTVLGIVAMLVAYHQGIMSVRHDDEATSWMLLFVLGGFANVIGPYVVLNAVYWNLYVSRCPKLFLLREFAKLVK